MGADENNHRNKAMGAVERFPVPKVWSPAGGWWCNPVNWRRNTKIAALVSFPVACYIFGQSVHKEERPTAGRPMPYVNMFGSKDNHHAVACRTTAAPHTAVDKH